MVRHFIRIAAALLLFLSAAISAEAQPASRVTLALRGTPLDEALALLVERTRIDLAYEPELVKGRYAYCAARDAAAEDALRCVLGGTGLDFYRLSNGLYVLTSTQDTALQRGVLQGRVVDLNTGQALADASVMLADAPAGTATNASGQFTFPRLQPGLYRLRVSHVGYRVFADTVRVAPGAVTRRSVMLAPQPAPILPIVVEGLAGRGGTPFTDAAATPSLSLLSTEAPDLTHRMAQLPGVHIGNVTADVHVQGGAAGEHDLRLDGAPVFAPPILLGMIGPFSPFAIGQLEVQKAGFGAEPGSNTVGIVEASQLVPPGRPLRLDAQVDALSLNLRLLGASRRAGRFLLAAREGLWPRYRLASTQQFLRDWDRQDTFLRAIFSVPEPAQVYPDPLEPYLDPPARGAEPEVGFRDLHAAYQIRSGPLSTLYVSGYHGERLLQTEGAAVPVPDRFDWRTQMAQARYTTVLHSRLFAQLQIRTSQYRLRHDYAIADARGPARAERDGNTISESAVEVRFDYTPAHNVLIEAGVAPTLTRDRFRVRSLRGDAIRHRAHAWRWASYANLRVSPTPHIQAELGFRATYSNDRNRVYPEPRVSLRYDSPRGRLGQLSLRAGAGLYEQFVGQYQVSSPSPSALVSTTRVWMAMDASIAPPRAEHYSGELRYSPAPGWELHAEAYYKHQFRLYTVDYAARLPETAAAHVPQSAFLAGGEGYAWGAGGRLEHRWGSNRVAVGGERAHVERGTPQFGFNYYVVPWNEPWRLTASADLQPFRSLVLLARWQSVWGRQWAFRQAYYDYLTASQQATGELPADLRAVVQRHVEASRLAFPVENPLPPLHQLDLGIAYSVRVGGAQLQYRLDALNVLDRGNVAELRLVGDRAYYEETGLLRAESRLLMPFTLVWAVRLTL